MSRGKRSKVFRFLSILLAIALIASIPVFASVNGDGHEGSAGNDGNKDNLYAGGKGWRVYLMDKDKQMLTSSQDIYASGKMKPKLGKIHWIGSTKLDKNSDMTLKKEYPYKFGFTFPDPGSNHKILEQYWRKSGYKNLKAMILGMGWVYSAEEITEKMQSGEWFIVMEPVMYVRVSGLNLAITATEAGKLNKYAMNGVMLANMGSATHNLLPGWAYFYETAWEIPVGKKFNPNGMQYQVPDDEMISTYGIIRIGMPGKAADTVGAEYDYEFHTNTEVIVSIEISSTSEINPNNPGLAMFDFPLQKIGKKYVIPANSKQLVWVSWTTPEEEGVIDVPISIGGGSSEKSSLKIKLTKLEENTPPDPQGRDTSPDFVVPALPTAENESSAEWIEWRAEWVPDMVWESDTWVDDEGVEHDDGEYVDYGEWEFDEKKFSAELVLENVEIVPDERAKTAEGQEMKSGYGLNTEVQVTVQSNQGTPGGGNYTGVQHVVATFPEFDYEYFTRLLEHDGTIWQFKENKYSQFENRVHFTPVWYPDSSNYVTSYAIIDCWTPVGQLYYIVNSDEIHISSNVFSDWHTAPAFAS